MRSLNVLTVGNMYPPHHLGGYEIVWRDLVAGLRGRGHRVRVLCSDHREPDPASGIAEDPDVHRELRWYWSAGEFPSLSRSEIVALERHNAARFAGHAREIDADVVLWGPMGGMSMSLLSQAGSLGLGGLAVVIDEWLIYGPKVDAFYRRTHRGGPLGRMRALAARVPRPAPPARGIDRIVFGSELVRRNAVRAQSAPGDSVVLRPGPDLELFRPAPVRERARAGGALELLCVGRLDPRKGHGVAVEALADLPGARLRIATAGESEHEDELLALAARLGVGERLQIDRPPRAGMAQVYADADVVLFPVQWEEPWGLVPLEAMAVGRPVVASAAGGSAEYLEHESNSLVYGPREDPSELAAAVGRLRADAGLGRRLVAGGHATAQRYSWTEFGGGVIEALEGLAA